MYALTRSDMLAVTQYDISKQYGASQHFLAELLVNMAEVLVNMAEDLTCLKNIIVCGCSHRSSLQ